MFFGIEELVLKSLHWIASNNPALFGAGAFILALISISTIALALVLIVCAVWIPFQLARRIVAYMKGDDANPN